MIHRSRIYQFVFFALSFFLGYQLCQAQTYDLTGAWKDDNGAIYCIRQIGNSIFWRMEGRPEVHNVYNGIIAGNYISGEWADLPGGQIRGNGSLSLRVESKDRLVKVGQSANYGGSVWTRTNDADCAAAATGVTAGPGAGTPSNTPDLSGTWVTTWSDPYSTSEQLWEVTLKEPGVWQIKATLLSTTHPYHQRSVCQTFDGGILRALPSGQYEFQRESTDSNPGNQCYFLQTATVTYYRKLETLSAEGTHKGSALTHWMKFSGKRGTDSRCQKGGSGGGSAGTGTGSGSGNYPLPGSGLSLCGAFTPTSEIPPATLPAPARRTTAAICDNPRVLPIMDYWLARAKPIQSPGPPRQLCYEPWGRVVETSDPSHLKAIGPPTTAKSRCEWLWEDSARANRMEDAAGVLGNFHEFVWNHIWLK
jgi:hypothetical protein